MSYRSRSVKPSTVLWTFVAAANIIVLAATAGLWLIVMTVVACCGVWGMRGGRRFQGSPAGFPHAPAGGRSAAGRRR
jgi:hypothetical protein